MAQKIKVGDGGSGADVLLPKGDGSDRKWSTRPLTKSVKREFNVLGEEVAQVVRDAREAASDPELATLTQDQEDKILRLTCDQISAITSPAAEADGPLGDALWDQWDDDKLTEGEIDRLRDELLRAAGKQSAS